MHWRWSDVFIPRLFGDQWNGGAPLVPNGSNQSVEVGLVRYHDLEEDPLDFHDLALPPEPLAGNPTVFWYSATGYQDHDTFFDHGGFFKPASSGPATLLPSITQSKSGNTLTGTFTVKNLGPDVAEGVSLNQAVTRVLVGRR